MTTCIKRIKRPYQTCNYGVSEMNIALVANRTEDQTRALYAEYEEQLQEINRTRSKDVLYYTVLCTSMAIVLLVVALVCLVSLVFALFGVAKLINDML